MRDAMAAHERGGQLLKALYLRSLGANLVGAAIAFVYLSFVAPPPPEPPHGEHFPLPGGRTGISCEP